MAQSAIRRLSTRVVSILGAMVLVLGVSSVALADSATIDPGDGPIEIQEPALLSVEPVDEPVDQTPEVTPVATDPADEPVAPSETAKGDEPVAEEIVLDDEAESLDEGMTPFAVGPDGGTAPYVYWTVKDTDGNLVPGATFKFEYRTSRSWSTETNADAISDCNGTCSTSSSGNVLDRDSDGGEFLLEHRGTNRNSTNRITAGSRYQVTQVTAPPGYEWVVNNKSVDSNSLQWSGTGNNRILNIGTFQVKEIETGLQCAAGYVYGLSATGQLQQVQTNGTVTNIGTPAPSVSSFNGLGIGSYGNPVYGYERTNDAQTVTMYSYNSGTGVWTSTGHTYNTTSSSNGGFAGSLVAGAVNLSNDVYMFGGFQTTDNGWFANPRYTQVFKIWQYNSTPGTFTYKGYISTYSGNDAQGSANGDMAFDAAGNLFVVRGSGTTTTVFSVTAANINGASGGQISTAGSSSFTTMNNVNGVAFDASGKAYLGSGSQVNSYDMPNWSNGKIVTSSNYSGTDLASCSSPPTIVIEKEIIGGRVNSGDQFKLTLNQGTTELGNATTTGSAIGLQDARIGPVPTVRGIPLTFAETAAGTTNMSDYASAYQCTVTYLDGTVTQLGQVSGTSGSVTIPATGDAVRCVFRNSPLIANVTIHKDVTDALGENPQPRANWQVGAAASATTGTITNTPSATTQLTNAGGDASWAIKFSAYTGRATVNVSETMQTGYEFKSGECVVTKLDGTETTTNLPDANATALTGVAPGDQVDCTYVNKPTPGALTITKAFDASVPDGSGTAVIFTGDYTCTLAGSTVAFGAWASTGAAAAVLTPAEGSPAADAIPQGALCSATETAPTGSDGLPNSSWQWGAPTVGADVTIGATAQNITVTNTATQSFGNFSVTKVVPEGSVVDAGMKFGGVWTCTLGEETVTGEWGPIAADATWTSAANTIPLGASCTVTETRTGEPVDDGSYMWDGDPVIVGSPAVTKASDYNVVTVTNTTKPVLGTVTWNKVDNTGAVLSGSEWTLQGPGEGGAKVAVIDCTVAPCAGPDMDPVAGQFKIENLVWGDYVLSETKAPAGFYVGDDEAFTIGSGDALNIVLGGIENTRITGPNIPLTGGIGRDAFLIGGLGVLTLGMGAAVMAQIRSRRREVA